MKIKMYILISLLFPIALFAQDYLKSTNGPYGANVRTMFVDSTGKIWAGTFEGLFVSTNQGTSWKKQSNYFTPTNFVITSKGKIIATHYWGGYDISTDQGLSWTYGSFPAGFYNIRCLYIDKNDRLFAGTDQGVFRSLDDGVNWKRISSVSESYAIGEDSEGRLYSSRDWSKVYYSTDLGDTWNLPDTMIIPQHNHEVPNFAFNSKNEIFGGGIDGLLVSNDKGKTWRLSRMDSGYIYINRVSIDKSDNIYAGTNKGIYISNDNANSWTKVNLGFKTFDASVTCIDSVGNIYISLNNSLIICSSNQGVSWKFTIDGLTNISLSTIDINSEDDLIVGSDCGNIYYSKDRGNQWIPIYTLPSSSKITTINWGENKSMYAGTYDDGLFYSSDMGLSWEPINNGLENKWIWSFMIASPNKYFVSAYGGTYISADKGKTWKKILNGTTSQLKKNNKGDLFAGYAGFSISEDFGTSWKVRTNGIKDPSIRTFAIYSDSILFAGNIHAGLYRSLDKGNYWVQLKNEKYGTHGEDFPTKNVEINSKGYVYAYVPFEGFLRSTDLGQTWEILNAWAGNALVFDKNDYMFTVSNGVYVSPVSTATTIPLEIVNTPKQYVLEQNYPNPFNPTTSISFEIPVDNYVQVIIYDCLGREVSTILNEYKHAGRYKIIFNGQNTSSGVYFYKMVSGSYSSVKKFMLIK